MKILFWIIFLVLMTNLTIEESPIFYDSLEDAVAFSEESGKDLLVIFTADWCSNCTIMKKDLQENIEIVSGTIICYVDIDDRKDLKKEYRVKLIPDYLILRKKIEIKRKVGYTNKDSFIKWFRNDK